MPTALKIFLVCLLCLAIPGGIGLLIQRFF